MDGQGITGLESIRQTLADQGAILARLDERTKAQGREFAEHRRAVGERFDEQGTTIDRISRKVDAAVQAQVESGGVAAGKKNAVTGVKDILTLLVGVSGVVAAIVIAATR